MTLLIALVALTSSAISASYPQDKDCGASGDGSTQAMASCFKVQSDIWEKRLTTQYGAVIARKQVDIPTLRQAQRAWLQYRARNCATYATVGGTLRTVLTAICWRDMTRNRTLELQAMNWKP